MSSWFGIHDGLATAGRIPSVTRMREHISAAEMIMLIACGAAATSAISFIKLGLRLPGHAIVLAMVPLALGFALAPRRLSGFIMSGAALSTAAVFTIGGLAQYGTGSFVSLCLMGPVTDLALTKARSGWRLYAGLIAAGLATNILALMSRTAGRLLGLDPSFRPFSSWITQALVTYSLSGALAGLIGAICFFHLRNRSKSDESGIES
jgi:hypothetical protein